MINVIFFSRSASTLFDMPAFCFGVDDLLCSNSVLASVALFLGVTDLIKCMCSWCKSSVLMVFVFHLVPLTYCSIS